MCKQCCFASMKQFLKLISAWAYEGHPRNALTAHALLKNICQFKQGVYKNSIINRW